MKVIKIANKHPKNNILIWTEEDEKLKEESNGEPVKMKLIDYRKTKSNKIAQLKRGWKARKKTAGKKKE